MFYIIFAILFISCHCNDISIKIEELQYKQNYHYEINKTIEYILEFRGVTGYSAPPRVTVSSDNANITAPLMIVSRQPKQLLSWQLPLIIESQTGNKIYNTTSRTLCYDDALRSSDDTFFNPIVTVSTDSAKNISFDINVKYEQEFVLKTLVEVYLEISPSEPRFYYYSWKEWEETTILEIESKDDVCMTVGIQNVRCPVFDTNEDITFRGFYATVSKKGGITIPRDKFPNGFYVVLVAKSDNSDCTGKPENHQNSKKHVSLILKPAISRNDYIIAVSITLASLCGFLFIFAIIYCVCTKKLERPRLMEYVDSTLHTPTTVEAAVPELSSDSISVDETEYDAVADLDTNRILRLGKSDLYLTDLARKDPRVLKHKSYLYLYNVLTVAIFYGLPVVQLVVTYQKVLNKTGEQDLCYYNFLCAHPLDTISDFNHVFSNIGYIFFGLLFLFVTYRREITHKDLDFDRQYGIPQHYGMFYAMGVALIMEGVLSGSYHVCPNQANFQFDSSFMYVMAVLCMVKLYQNRHPDINARACATFGVLAIAVLLGMIGIFEENLYFWVLFTVIYLLGCLYLSATIYYMGCWKLDSGLFKRMYRSIVQDIVSDPLNIVKPVHKARMVLLIIGNLCNWGLAFWGIYYKKDFAIFLLAVFMGNTMLYFIFYVCMKYLNKERVNLLSLGFLIMSTLCACSAMYFFLHKGISWKTTPAQSREFNQSCKLFKFYDNHDIWHFLSAVGMFFTFMVLLTLDDDLSHTHRSLIRVF